MGTARDLAVAAGTLRHLLWVRAGFAGTSFALVGAAIEQARRSDESNTPMWACRIALWDLMFSSPCDRNDESRGF